MLLLTPLSKFVVTVRQMHACLHTYACVPPRSDIRLKRTSSPLRHGNASSAFSIDLSAHYSTSSGRPPPSASAAPETGLLLPAAPSNYSSYKPVSSRASTSKQAAALSPIASRDHILRRFSRRSSQQDIAGEPRDAAHSLRRSFTMPTMMLARASSETDY